jgi:hypothetical protein
MPPAQLQRMSATSMDDDRRSTERTRTSKAGSIFFGRQTDEPSCDVEVRDVANGGAGIYKSGLSVLPLTFELSFDNLRRKCRMVWRKGNFFGVTFEEESSATLGHPATGEPDDSIDGPALSMLESPPLLASPYNTASLTEFMSKIAEQRDDQRADFRFILGVAIALALPALISIGAYVATNMVLGGG